MPLEEDRVWAPSTVVPLDEILERMREYRPLVEIPHGRSETARRYRFEDGIGEIGIVGMPAAVANAIFHATGMRVCDLPITPDKLL